MTQLEILNQEKENRWRTLLASEVARAENTYAAFDLVRSRKVVASSLEYPAHKLGKSKLTFHLRETRGPRLVMRVRLYRVAFGRMVLLRTYQIRIPAPKGPTYVLDVSSTNFPAVHRSFDSWVGNKVKSLFRLPWSRRTNRAPSEGSTLILTTGWVEFGVVRSFAQTPYVDYQRSWVGTVTPGFGKLKKKDLPVNNYGLTLLRRGNYGEYSHSRQYDSAGNLLRDDQHWWDFSIPGGDSEPQFTAELVGNAVKKLASNAQSNATSNVALNIAQIQLTADMIARSATRIAGSLSALRRGNFAKATQLLWQNQRARFPNSGPKSGSSLANNWLELQYGWKPLLSDVRGSMEALARFNYANTAVRRVTASVWRTTSSDQPLGINHQPNTIIGSLKTETREVCRYGVKYRLASPLVAFLAQTGFTNPVNLAWELLPFSFVVDWFLPVGPYLETLGQWDGLEFMEGYQTRFIRRRLSGRTYFSGTYNHLDPSWHTERYGAYSSLWVKHARAKITSFPSVPIPEVRSGVNVTRALNALALLRVVFGK